MKPKYWNDEDSSPAVAKAGLATLGEVRANKAAVTQPGPLQTALVNMQICKVRLCRTDAKQDRRG